MKGVDYTKQLAKERDHFQDALVKNRAATDKRMTDNEARHEHIETKQRDNFIEDRAELETGYQKSLDNIKDKTKASLDAKNENYNKKMEDERVNFERDRNSNRADFDRRLEDIKNGYAKSFKSDKQNHEQLQANNKTRYTKNIQDLNNTQNQKVGQYRDRMLGAGADLKEQYNREREQLVRNNEDHVNSLRLSEADKRSELQGKVSRDIRLTKEVNAAEKEQTKTYTDDKIKRIQQFNDEHTENVARDYTQKADDLSSAKQKEAIRANHEEQEKIAEVRRGFDKHIRSNELEKRRLDNGSGEFGDVNKKQMGLSEQDRLDNKINSLRTNLKDTQKDYQLRTNTDRSKYGETLKAEATEATMRQDRAVNDINADKIITVTKEREKSADAVATRDYINKLDKQASEAQLMQERNSANNRIANLNENFNKAMSKLEEKMKLSIEDVTTVSNDDKTKFVKDINDKRAKEVFEMKREFAIEMDRTVQSYEQRLASAARENGYLKLTMDQKVENIMDQSQKKMDSERTIFEERRKADKQDALLAIDQREHKLRTEMNTVIVNYQTKLDKMQIDTETKMKLITNNYENRLSEQNTLKGKELAAKDTTNRMEVQKLQSAFEDEKNRLISAYENKIAGMTAGHEERMLQLDEYKKLS